MTISAIDKARPEALAKAKRVSTAARRVVEIFDSTPRTIHYGYPVEMYSAMRRLKNALDKATAVKVK